MTLMQMRATYIVQLFLTVTNANAVNMKNVYEQLKARTILKKLADMDGCLISFESLSQGWLSAFTDLRLQGDFDVKTTLKGIKLRPVTDAARKLLHDATIPTKPKVNQDADGEHNESIFNWNELLKFGSSGAVPSAEKVLEMQVAIQLELFKFSNKTESPYRERLVIHCVAPDEENQGSRSKGTTYDLLLLVTEHEALMRHPKDENLLMYKLPSDFALVFWGAIGSLA